MILIDADGSYTLNAKAWQQHKSRERKVCEVSE